MRFYVSRRRPQAIPFIMEQLRGAHYHSTRTRVGISLLCGALAIGCCVGFIYSLVQEWPITPNEIITVAGSFLLLFVSGPLLAYAMLGRAWRNVITIDDTTIAMTDYGLFRPKTMTISITSIVDLLYHADQYGLMGLEDGREAPLGCTASMNRILHNLPPFPLSSEEVALRHAVPAQRIRYLFDLLSGVHGLPHGGAAAIARGFAVLSALGSCVGLVWLQASARAGIVLGVSLVVLLGTLVMLRNPLCARRAFRPAGVIAVSYSLLGCRREWSASIDQITALSYQRGRRHETLTFYLCDHTAYPMRCSASMSDILRTLPAFITDTRITDTPETDAAPD
ncbi:MAG: hypothetical protein MI924_18095 [Chloroflexales bacterium]|nr:hypothetical protein [Chloroflexales bacterium]